MSTLTVNGVAHPVSTVRTRSLLYVLRQELGLTGAKLGCGEGECGACTVLVDGEARQACKVPIADAVGHAVTTIEGLARDGALHPVQQAFLDAGAFQCGFCTPGMILSAVALLAHHPRPADHEIVAAMNGNLCRCCGYPRILDAIRRAAGGTP